MSDQHTLFESLLCLNGAAHDAWRESIYAKASPETTSLLKYVVDATDRLVADNDPARLVPAGFIATFPTEHTFSIDGMGTTEEEAITDARYYTAKEDGKCYTVPTTAALMAAIARDGHSIYWSVHNGIMCTPDEADAARKAQMLRHDKKSFSPRW